MFGDSMTATEVSITTPDIATTPVALTAPAALKVRELLDAEGRTDLRLRVAVQPAAVPACSTSCSSTSAHWTAT